jgi:septin family protein
LPPKKRSKKTEEDGFQMPVPASGNFIPHYLETEIDGERVGLTLWDSEGLEKNLVDLQLREMSSFLESKFEETFTEEMKVVRSPGVQDTHIHAAFLVLDPSRLDRNIAAGRKMSNFHQNGHHSNGIVSGALDDGIDMPVLRLLQGKTTVIPVISKADTVTTKHMNVLKKAVWSSLKKSNMDPLEALGLDDEDGNSISSSRIEEKEEDGFEDDADDSDEIERDIRPSASASPNSKRLSVQSVRRHRVDEYGLEEETPFLPLSIISPDLYEPGVVGRQFPWGFADPYNEEHCDFTRLKEAVFSEWRGDLRVASREQWYEGWRTNRLKHKSLPYRRH